MSSIFDDIVDFAFGWLIPDVETPERDPTSFQEPNRLQFVYGEYTRIAGQAVRSLADDKYGGGIPNETIYVQYMISAGAIESIDKVYVNDKEYTEYAPYVVIHKSLDGSPVNVTGEGGVTHTFDSKGKGHAFIVIEIRQRESEGLGYYPDIAFSGKGRKIKNLQNADTVAYSDNPADVLYDYMTDPLGGALPAHRINKASFVTEGAWCDTLVFRDETQSTQVKIATMNIVLDGNLEVRDNINEIRKNARAFLPRVDGQYTMVIERERTPVAYEITDSVLMGDFIVTDTDKSQRYNQVQIRYPKKSELGKDSVVTYPEDNTAYLLEDNNVPNVREVTLSGINDVYHAKQAAYIIFHRSRDGLIAKCKTDKTASVLKLGDVVNVSNSAFGMVQKPFIVVAKTRSTNDIYNFELLEYQESIYPWIESPAENIPDSSVPDYSTVAAPVITLHNRVDDIRGQYYLEWTSDQSKFDVFVGNDLEVGETANKFAYIRARKKGTYTLKVRAINELGYKSQFAEVTAVLAPPLAIGVGTINVDISKNLITFSTTQEAETKEFKIVILGVTDPNYNGTINVPATSAQTYTAPMPVLKNGDYNLTIYPIGENGLEGDPSTPVQFTYTITGTPIGEVTGNVDLLEDVVSQFEQWNPAAEIAELFTNVFNDYKRQEDNRATLTVAQDAGLTADGALEVVNGVKGEIDDPVTGLNATFAIAQQAQVTADGAASATSALETRVTDAESDISANATLIQSVQTTATGNTTAIQGLDTRVTDNENFAAAQLTLNSEFDADIGTVKARAFLGTDVNNRVTGIVINDSGTEQQIQFQSDSVAFLDANGVAKVYYDLVNDKFVYSGTIDASEIIGGTITGATIKSAETGQRIELQGTVQRFYNSSGVQSAALTGFTNGLSIIGSAADSSVQVLSSSSNITTYARDNTSVCGITANRNLKIESTAVSGFVDVDAESGVRLFIDAVEKLRTTSTGVDVYGTVNETSDPKLKDFIGRLDGKESLDLINKLDLFSYTWKDETFGSELQVGVNAEQAAQLFPYAIGKNAEGLLSFNYRAAFIHGLAAIKELSSAKNQIDVLKSEVGELTEKINEILSNINNGDKP